MKPVWQSWLLFSRHDLIRQDWARMSEGTSRIRTQVGTNGNSWKPKTCTATRGRYLWLQKWLSGKMAVRRTFLGSAPDTWVHFLYFSHSGRITPSSPSSLITSCLKTSRRCVMSLNRVRGKWVDDVFCKDDANLSANTLYAPNCKTWEVTTQTWNRAFAFKLKVTSSHWKNVLNSQRCL